MVRLVNANMLAIVVGFASWTFSAMALQNFREVSCLDHFPQLESVQLLERIVDEFASEETFLDSLGMETTRKVIRDTADKLTEKYQLSLEPTSRIGECTFRFEAKRYFRLPVYVRTSSSEEAYPFNRLHYQCPMYTRCCALFCCPEETIDVQQKFALQSEPATDSSDFRSISENVGVEVGSAKFALSPSVLSFEGRRFCAYYVSDSEMIRLTVRLNAEREVKAIYFTCPKIAYCCQLKCAYNNSQVKEALMLEASISREFSMDRPSSAFSALRIDYIICTAFFVTSLAALLFGIYVINQKRVQAKRKAAWRYSTPSLEPTELLKQSVSEEQFFKGDQSEVI